jgi:hypothetical protein
MDTYEDYPYHKLRRLYQTIPSEENPKLTTLIAEYYHKAVRRSVFRQHPDWSIGQIKSETFRRIYKNDFSAEELNRIAESMQDWHDNQG